VFLLNLDLPKKSPYPALLRKIRDLQSKKPSAILLFLKEADLDNLSPYVTYPSYFPPSVEGRLKQRDKEGRSVSRWMEASKIASRAREPEVPIDVPVLIVPSLSPETENDSTSVRGDRELGGSGGPIP